MFPCVEDGSGNLLNDSSGGGGPSGTLFLDTTTNVKVNFYKLEPYQAMTKRGA